MSISRKPEEAKSEKVMPSKNDLINTEDEAIEEAVAWHTVGIVAEDGQAVGTGSAILWRQRPLILTAWHVIESSPDDDSWFYFRDEGTMKRSPIDELPNRRDVEYKAKVRIKMVGRCCSKNADLPFSDEVRVSQLRIPLRVLDRPTHDRPPAESSGTT